MVKYWAKRPLRSHWQMSESLFSGRGLTYLRYKPLQSPSIRRHPRTGLHSKYSSEVPAQFSVATQPLVRVALEISDTTAAASATLHACWKALFRHQSRHPQEHDLMAQINILSIDGGGIRG